MPTAPTGPATRAHRKTSVVPPTNVDPNSTKPTFPIRVSSYGPRTRAGVVGDLFETAHNAIAPVWQPGAYIRSCELSSVVERTHSNLARKTKGWLEHEIHHAAENSRGIIEVPAARVSGVSDFLARR